MAAAHRRKLEAMSAPVIAWLIDNDYVANEGGVLEVTTQGWYHLKEATRNASRHTQGHLPVPGV